MTAKQTSKKDDSGDEKKYFDVSKPGESAAGPTSRPVIVRRSMVKKDPMVTGDNEDEPQDTEKSEDKKQELKDKPVEVKVESGKKNQKEDKPEEGAKEESKEEKQSQTADSITEEEPEQTDSTQDEPKKEENAGNEPAKQETSEESSGSSESGEVEALAGEADSKKTSQQQENQESKEAEARQKLIDSKQYYLNIGEIKRRRTATNFLIVLFLLAVIVAIGYLLALDAEIIDGSMEPVTDIL